MSERVPVTYAQKHWREVLERAEKGERIILTRGRYDVATLGPAPVRPARPCYAMVPTSGTFDDKKVRDLLGTAFPQKRKGSGG